MPDDRGTPGRVQDYALMAHDVKQGFEETKVIDRANDAERSHFASAFLKADPRQCLFRAAKIEKECAGLCSGDKTLE